MFRLLIKHFSTKKFKIHDKPPGPSIPAPTILLFVPRASLAKGLEGSFHPYSYAAERLLVGGDDRDV
jgi:hypothetical protein